MLPHFSDSASCPKEAIEQACRYEVEAPKAGNVHPTAAFEDMNVEHFRASAHVIAPILAASSGRTVGELILEAAQATRECVGLNTNLGTILLFAPILKAFENASDVASLQNQLPQTIAQIDALDAERIYDAIRCANPGGMGRQSQNDVNAVSKPTGFLDAMAQVDSFDAVARQYTKGFQDLFERLLPWFNTSFVEAHAGLAPNPIHEAICRLQVRWLAYEPDGLIVRKLGFEEAWRVTEKARILLETFADLPTLIGSIGYQDLDGFLRQSGHRRNPGTTADLIAATLLVRLLF